MATISILQNIESVRGWSLQSGVFAFQVTRNENTTLIDLRNLVETKAWSPSARFQVRIQGDSCVTHADEQQFTIVLRQHHSLGPIQCEL
jgi:hypothetical protein